MMISLNKTASWLGTALVPLWLIEFPDFHGYKGALAFNYARSGNSLRTSGYKGRAISPIIAVHNAPTH